MKYFSIFFQVVFLTLFLLEHSHAQEVTFHSPNYFSQSKNEFDPLLFLDTENIIFSICDSNIENIKSSITCSDSNEVQNLILHSAENGCYISQAKEVSCEESELKIEYKQDEKNVVYIKELVKTKESEVVDFILEEDFSDISNPLELSYYLIVYNKVKGDDETSKEIYEKLRNLRNNNNKCWPSNKCNVETTTEILHNLKLADYELDSRLLEDGLIYLDKVVRSSSSSSGRIEIEIEYDSSQDVNCILRTDNTIEFNETFNESENISRESFSNNFSLSCNRDVDKIKFIIEDPVKGDFNETLTNEREYDYELVDSFCYGNSNCNIKSTLEALITYNKELEFYNDLKIYIEDLKLNLTTNQKYINSKSNSIFSSMYLNNENNKEIANFVKFIQNNDGSWGDSSNRDDRIEETFWGVLGLEEASNSEEHILDAENWVYFSEPNNGWESNKNNALAYLIIEKYIRPFLILDYEQKIEDSVEFTIENPSIFDISNIEIEIDSSIEPYIQYTTNLGSVDAKSEIKFNLTSEDKILSDKSGNIKIFGVVDGVRKELIEAPIIITSNDVLDFPQESIFYSRDLPLLNIPLSYSQDFEITCEVKDSINNENKEVKISKTTKNIEIKNTNLFTGELILEFDCKANNDKISFSKQFSISQSKALFEVMNSNDISTIINFDESSIIFQSLTSDTQEISLEFENSFFGIIEFSEQSFRLNSNDKKEITFSVNQEDLLESLDNLSDNIVITSNLGYVQKIPFMFNYEETTSLSFLYITIGVLFSLLLLLILYRAYELRKDEKDDEFDESEDEFEFDDLELN